MEAINVQQQFISILLEKRQSSLQTCVSKRIYYHSFNYTTYYLYIFFILLLGGKRAMGNYEICLTVRFHLINMLPLIKWSTISVHDNVLVLNTSQLF